MSRYPDLCNKAQLVPETAYLFSKFMVILNGA
jgi:hypothetical protein